MVPWGGGGGEWGGQTTPSTLYCGLKIRAELTGERRHTDRQLTAQQSEEKENSEDQEESVPLRGASSVTLKRFVLKNTHLEGKNTHCEVRHAAVKAGCGNSTFLQRRRTDYDHGPQR